MWGESGRLQAPSLLLCKFSKKMMYYKTVHLTFRADFCKLLSSKIKSQCKFLQPVISKHSCLKSLYKILQFFFPRDQWTKKTGITRPTLNRVENKKRKNCEIGIRDSLWGLLMILGSVWVSEQHFNILVRLEG